VSLLLGPPVSGQFINLCCNYGIIYKTFLTEKQLTHG